MTTRDKTVYEIFDDIIEVDFNPDIVQVGLLDSYDEGHMNGMIAGGAIGTIITIGCVVLINLVKKNKKQKKES